MKYFLLLSMVLLSLCCSAQKAKLLRNGINIQFVEFKNAYKSANKKTKVFVFRGKNFKASMFNTVRWKSLKSQLISNKRPLNLPPIVEDVNCSQEVCITCYYWLGVLLACYEDPNN